jgi:2-polyprenyl-3-methyl-5-hydroxy-6-metoxy-1,4-benzoquinol methylase
MKRFDAAAYFARRAPRYQNALKGCPSARVLDLVPYVAALSASGLEKRKSLRVCDAFGGTGFLARSLHGNRFSFVVCDCCQEMLTGALGLPRVGAHVTPDDFSSAIRVFGGGFFDLVLCHGGLHHVVVLEKASVDPAESERRQLNVVDRLAKLVRPGGVIIIADIPDKEPPELDGPLWDQEIEATFLCDCLGNEGLQLVAAATGLEAHAQTTLKSIQAALRSKLVKPFRSPVPRLFFDSFVAKETATGHTAAYVNFDQIHERLIQDGFLPLGRINYRGPWLFSSANEAGWFFKEKFSAGEPSAKGADVNSEANMLDVLQRMLGVRNVTTGVAVNWGVTYGIYQKLEGAK